MLVIACAVISLPVALINAWNWDVVTLGSWADAQIVSIHHCTGRYGQVFSTVALDVTYVDAAGHTQSGEASCERNVYAVGQVIPVRYLSNFPWRVKTRDDMTNWSDLPLLISLPIAIITTLLSGWLIRKEALATRATLLASQQLRARRAANVDIARAQRSQQRRSRRNR